MLTNRQEIIFFCTLGALVLLFTVLIFIVGTREIKKAETKPFDVNTPLLIANIPIEAKAAYVLDISTGKVLYAKNENVPLPLASLTKVMSALVAAENTSLQSTVVVTPEAISTEGDSGLLTGERWTLKNLIDFSLVSSANDGIAAVALSFGSLDNFVNKMNTTAFKIGMSNTHYLNPTGLDESQTLAGATGSAKDQALLMKYILQNYPNLLSATKESDFSATSLDGLVHRVKNTDTIVNQIPGLIASKTGYTDLAGGNLLIAWNPELGRPIIISVLGSTQDGRFKDMQKLVDASLAIVGNSVISSK